MSETILAANNISFDYPDGTTGLDDLSLTVRAGQKVVILGPNGAGKSTLFRHLNGILEPQQGQIFFAGTEINYDRQSLTNLREKVGLIFQDPERQLFSASVAQELSFGPLNLGLSEVEVESRVQEAMQVTGISELQEKPTHLLSYGQKKRVAIAGVLAMKPDVIIFDEPTAGLDPQGAQELISFLDRLQEDGKTIVIATHDVNLAYSWSDYIYILEEGSQVGAGTAQEIFQDDELLAQTNLVSPVVLNVYQQLQAADVVTEAKIPKTEAELLELIKQKE